MPTDANGGFHAKCGGRWLIGLGVLAGVALGACPKRTMASHA